MTYRTLVTAEQLLALRAQGTPLVLLDCNSELTDPTAGARIFRSGHLPGAHHVNLDLDLSGPKSPEGPRSPAFTGRHPLPDRVGFAALVGRLGIAPDVQVVAYDGQGGPYASRAWWLLRWLGHEAVAVLDGGTAAWQAAGGTLSTEETPPSPRPPYPAAAPAMATIDAAALRAGLGRVCIVDARAGARFRGETEPLDPVAGHIPGARHRFFQDNLAPDGRFKPADRLRAEFEPLLEPGVSVVHQCGSGVTACHNLLAMAHAGLGDSVLYPGSWSEWCADPARPVERG